MHRNLLAGAVGLLAGSLEIDCGGPLDLGTNVVWSTDNETGDLSGWTSPPGSGGVFQNSVDATVEISTTQARSGRHSIKISSSAASPAGSPDTPGGGGVYKQGAFPNNAFYSIWYYLPRAYQTGSAWTILSFRSGSNGANDTSLIDIRLQSSPGGDMALVVYDHRRQYLASPLSDPPGVVPIGRWFQIESFYRNANDSTGHLTIWLDGTIVYDLTRPTGSDPAVYFSPCSLVNVLSPAPAEIYMDDIAISRSRIRPTGTLKVPQ